MDQACKWVIKYFSCLLGNAVPNDDIIVTSRSHHSSDSSVASSFVQAGGGHFEHKF